ncbi:MAG: hypothetical protein AMXMBFR51_20910 [Ignavibacteriota bacterium]
MKKTSIAKCFGVKKNTINMWEMRNANKKSNLRNKIKFFKPGNGGGTIQSLLHSQPINNDKIM